MSNTELSLLSIPINVLSSVEDKLGTLGNISAFRSLVGESASKEKDRLGSAILTAINNVIDEHINGVDTDTGFQNKEFTQMSSSPSFLSSKGNQDDTKRFIKSMRLSEHIEYFDILNDAFNIDTFIEIHYKSKLNDTDVLGVQPYECSYRTFEDSNMRHVSVILNIHNEDMSQIERGIGMILDDIHSVFYTIFSDITEDHNYELRSSVQDKFTVFLNKFTGKSNPNDEDLDPDMVQDIYYFTLGIHALKFYQARQEYNRILGIKVEPQNILTTKKLHKLSL